MNSFGVQLGDWGTCCYNSSLYIQFGNQASNTWEGAQLIGTATKIADVPEQANGKTYTFIGAINDTNFFDMVRIYGDGNGDVLYAGGTIYTGSVALNSVPASAGSSTQTSSSDIDKAQSQYLASNLGGSVNPAFVGGTLKSDVASVTQNFTIDDSVNGASSTIDQNGMDSNYSGVLSNAAGKTGSITISNSGTGGSVTFSGSNTYTGTTTIDGNATLALSGNGSISSSSAVIDNGSLDISATNSGASINSLSGNGAVALGSKTLTLSNANDTFAGVIAGSGGLTVAGGNEILTGANTYSGSTTISSGAGLTLSGNGSLASTAVNIANGATLNDNNSGLSGAANLTADGALTLGADEAIAQLNGATSGTVALGAHTLTIGNGGSFAGVVSGTGGLTVAGGNETLTGANTYSGSTTIRSGAGLTLSGNGSLANSTISDAGSLTLAANAAAKSLSGAGTVNLGGNTLTLNNAGDTFSGVIAGSGGLALNGGTEVLSGSNTYSGGTRVNAGTLVVSSDANLGSGALTLNGGTLHSTASFATSRELTLQTGSTSAINTDSGTNLLLEGVVSGAGNLLKNGSGTLEVNGAHNTFSGQTTINGGVVQIDDGASLGTGLIVLNGGTLQTLSTLSNAQQVLVSGSSSVNTNAGTTATMSGTVTSSGSSSCFNKTGAGTLNMTGNATLSNGTCVQEGTLRANGDLTSNVTVDSSGTLRGTGVINGTTTVTGKLAPGNSPGTLVSTGTVTMTSGSTFEEDIDGTGIGTGAGNYSRLIITGSSSQFVAAGTLTPLLRGITTDPAIPSSTANNTFTPSLGDSFRIITAAGGIVGRFDSLVQPSAGLAADTQLVAFYNQLGSNSVDLRLTPTSYAKYLGGSNQNARNVGSVLDKVLGGQVNNTDTTAQSNLLYAVAGLNAEQLKTASRRLSGEVHAALAATAPLASRALQNDVSNHLQQDAAAGVNQDGTPARVLWANSNVDHQQLKADDFASGYKTNRSQFSVGIDAYTTSQTRAGFGMSHAETSIGQESGSGSLSETMVFVYGSQAVGKFYLDGMASIGSADWGSSRRDPLQLSGGLASGATGSNALLSTGLRMPITLDKGIVEPFARVIWQRSSHDAQNEGAASVSALSMQGYAASGVRSMIGFSGKSLEQDPLKAAFTYQLSLAVGQDSGKLSRPQVDSQLAGLGVSTSATHSGRQFVQTQLNGTLKVGKQSYLYGGVNGELAQGRSEYGASAGLRIAF
ncbi:autotransporter outer membrane beta-barrel domain-containing protein [Aquitalea denitrificans]|uniref:autotransporter outer membrane beta-barrel domain-containing protein n=1 Tax=Aquitalea denitrificans TaxID=519081 RepID=UPI0013588CAD|nr:autotransporter-associated beta strand repeat-containing protein [Aquitalea denitrificans]